jgi:beta-N-acetylhexosaminidase
MRLTRIRKQPGLQTIGSQAHAEAAQLAARRAITLVRDPKDLVPLRLSPGDKILVVQFAGAAQSLGEPSDETTAVELENSKPAHGRYPTLIGRALAEGPARIHEQIRSLDPAGHEHKELLMAAGTANAVVAVTAQLGRHPLQARAVADLAMIGKRLIVIAGREPYDARVLPDELTVIASYGEDAFAMRAAADVILGAQPASGVLPVKLGVPIVRTQ